MEQSEQENEFIDKDKNLVDAQADSNTGKSFSGDFKENGNRALIIMPEDGEISEVTQMADVLRRAGINVIIASLDDSNCVRSSSNIPCYVDARLSDVCKEPLSDAVILPGGLLGAKLLGESKIVGDLLREYEANHKWIVAIGDAPPVLRKHFIGKGKTLTCHPLIRHKIEGSEYMKYKYIDDDVFVDGKIITCKGGPHTTQCALNLVHLMCGRKIAENIAEKLLIEYDDGFCRDCCGNCKYCCREDKKEIESDIADRFACSTCCAANDEDVAKWEEDKIIAKIFATEDMINCKIGREELKDLEREKRIEKEETEKRIKEDEEEFKNLKDKLRNCCCVSEEESATYRREYVEQEEAAYNALMSRKYQRQWERHEKSKRRQNLIGMFRNLQPAEIDSILAEFESKENL